MSHGLACPESIRFRKKFIKEINTNTKDLEAGISSESLCIPSKSSSSLIPARNPEFSRIFKDFRGFELPGHDFQRIWSLGFPGRDFQRF